MLGKGSTTQLHPSPTCKFLSVFQRVISVHGALATVVFLSQRPVQYRLQVYSEYPVLRIPHISNDEIGLIDPIF
jgi:hypothetical protein